MSEQEYKDIVASIEEPLAPYAKRSFEVFSPQFLDGSDYHQFYMGEYENNERRSRILSRTPLQIERDRILYSSGMRKLTEKYHVLYSGNSRITRNFTTHTMRMAQVARSICNGLKLNADFAEAIALGSKSGAPPFVHASKKVVSKWIEGQIKGLDDKESVVDQKPLPMPQTNRASKNQNTDLSIPEWIKSLESKKIAEAVKKYIPWASCTDEENPSYSSGSQGYWSLAVDPYLVQSRQGRFAPETMFGIWRHSLGLNLGSNSFSHKMEFESSEAKKHEISWSHVTYEAIVVQYADDITWVIENLDDAHRASVLSGGSEIYPEMLQVLLDKGISATTLNEALFRCNSGDLYNYFITNFISYSKEILKSLKDSADKRIALREGSSDAKISLPLEIEVQLKEMKDFLNRKVFNEPRVSNRFQILRTISQACLELLYSERSDALENYIKTHRSILGLKNSEEKFERSMELLRDPVHRVQLAADIFSQMSDQEIYDFVGIQGL